MNLYNLITGALLGLAITTACAYPKVAPSRPNKQFYVQDLESRVHSLPEAIQQDIDSGKLKVVLNEVPKEDKDLNAGYNRDTDTITLECNPESTSCLTDGLGHEVGHYIYKNIKPEQRVSAVLPIYTRLHQPDAAAFQREIETIDQIFREFNTLYVKSVKPTLGCNLLLQDQGLQQRFSAYAKKENVDSSLVEVEFRNYQGLYPSCTTENLDKSSKILSKVIVRLKEVSTRLEKVYGQKRILDSPEQEQEQERDYARDLPLQIEEADKFTAARQNYLDVLHNAISSLQDESAYLDIMSRMIDRWPKEGEMAQLDMRVSNATISGGHDSNNEEQFAAGIASLFDLYNGPVVTRPMEYSLSEDILKEFAGIDYKGTKILAPFVQRYEQLNHK